MANVDLGYSAPCPNWRLQSKFFPSKIGGKPAWLDLVGVPSGDEVSCSKCSEPMSFLCQVYAPYREDENNFHRTIFLFVCRKPECHKDSNESGVVAFRSNLRRRGNKFYVYDPPKEVPDPEFPLKIWLDPCYICGCRGTQKSYNIFFCSNSHRWLSWKDTEWIIYGRERPVIPQVLYPESKIVIEPEELDKNKVNEEEYWELVEQVNEEEYWELVEQGKCGTMTELGQFSAHHDDVTFSIFCKRVNLSPDQVLRYDRGGLPLFISDEGVPETIPNCDSCGGPRQFEFQVMPHIKQIINERDIDWGILMCYTCVNSCTGGANYKREYVIKQNVSAVDLPAYFSYSVKVSAD